MKLGRWSTTAANNNTTPPDGWPEGQAPSTVNDCAREMMASIRTVFNNAQFFDQDMTPTFVSTTSFTVPGDQTSAIHAGRRLQLFDATTLYGTVSTASFTLVTTVALSLDSGVLTNSLSSFAIGIISVQNSGLPPASNAFDRLSASAIEATGTLTVSGATVLKTTLTVSGATALMSTLSVSGAAQFNSTLTVSGTLVCMTDMSVSGAAAFGATLSVSGNAVVHGNLSVSGSTVLAALSAGATHIDGTLSVSGAAQVAGALSVGGALKVDGTVSLSSTLQVVGAASFGGATTFGTTVSISGAVVLQTTLSVSGAAVFATTVSVSGAACLQTTLTVSGAAVFNGAVQHNTTTTCSGAVAMLTTLTVSGAASFLTTLSVSGASTLKGALSVGGAATFASTLSVSGTVVAQNVAKAWGSFSLTAGGAPGLGTLFNISSVSRSATGVARVTFSTAFVDSAYTANIVSFGTGIITGPSDISRTTTTCKFTIRNAANSGVDAVHVNMEFYR